MKHPATQYKRHRFPPEIIQYAVWLYYRFNLSQRDIEDLLARRGILVTHESTRFWCNKFGPHYAHRLRRRHRGFGDTLFIDEVGDILLQERRDATSAERFFRHLLTRLGHEPRAIVTDKLGSYAVARRKLLPGTPHDTRRYANNRADLSHQPTRVRERGMRRVKSMFQAQRFVSVHAAVSNLFNLGRHLVAAGHYRTLRHGAFASWDRAVAI
jgi:putative transposase